MEYFCHKFYLLYLVWSSNKHQYFDKEFQLSNEIVKNNVWNTYTNFVSKIDNAIYSKDNNFIIELDKNLEENMALEEHGIFLKDYLD